MLKNKTICIGGSIEDISLETKEGILINNKKDILRQNLLAFEYGAKIKIDKSEDSFGGGASNAAISLSRLGLSVSTLVCVGNDERGKRMLANFKNHKVNTSLIQKLPGKSGFSFILIGQGNEHIVFSSRGVSDQLTIGEKEEKAIKKVDWVYLSSLSGKWKSALQNIFKIKNNKVVWNPGGRQLAAGVGVLSRYLLKTEVLIMNKDEAIELVVSHKKYRSKDNKFLNNTKSLLIVLKSWGPNIVIITEGKKGAMAFDGKDFYTQRIIKAQRVIDTTGVGDAFASSFLAGMILYKNDIQRSLLLGVRNAASVISVHGAQNGLILKRNLK